MWKVVQLISGWTDIQNPYRLSRGRIYICVCVCVEFLASHFNDLSKFTGWAIMEELSIRRRHSRLLPICDAFFIQRGHRRSLPIGEESDDGHRIKRALYIGIKRLWSTTPHISGQLGTKKNRVKYCYVDLSSWYGFWFAIICIDLNVNFWFFYRNPTI